MRVCVITDNEFIYNEFQKIVKTSEYKEYVFDFYYSSWNHFFLEKYKSDFFKPINLKKKDNVFYKQYDLFLSLHSKQIFPSELVENYRCINIHPGYNPYNRGWYPQVFSILNKKPVGVTIHLMDDKLDHGPILFQEEVQIKESDTSYDIYQRIQQLEISLLRKHLLDIVNEKYIAYQMEDEGNINYEKDFKEICEIDKNKEATYGEVIDFLRAMTFEKYNNAFFYDENGKKIFVKIKLEPEDKNI